MCIRDRRAPTTIAGTVCYWTTGNLAFVCRVSATVSYTHLDVYKRQQLLCFGAAVAIGLPLFFLTKDSAGTTTDVYKRQTLPLRWLPPATLLWTCHLGTPCVASCSQPTSLKL